MALGHPGGEPLGAVLVAELERLQGREPVDVGRKDGELLAEPVQVGVAPSRTSSLTSAARGSAPPLRSTAFSNAWTAASISFRRSWSWPSSR